MSNITFTCTRLAGTNKVGDLKKNERGYYPMVVGALNMFNSAGMYYQASGSVKAFFEESSALMRRVSNGALRGEYGHPRQEIGMTVQQYFARLLAIYEKNTCCHFASLSLDFTTYKDAQNRPIVAIIAEVAPSGPFGYVLEKQLQNPSENVCFSVRSFTDDRLERGVINRYIKTIVTFDYVNEPGMSVADKFNAQNPALESLEETTFTRGQVEASSGKILTMSGVGNESAQMNLGELMSTLGWNLPEQVKAAKKAAWADWS